MADSLLEVTKEEKQYWNRREYKTLEDYLSDINKSSTLYIGNLTRFTREEAIYSLFSQFGKIKLLKIGMNQQNQPVGFCFVEYYAKQDAKKARDYLNGYIFDDRIIRVDWDVGFSEGRQFARGKSGGQVRDDFRQDDDPGRFGGKKKQMNDNRNESRYSKRRDYSSGSDSEDDYRRRKK